MVLPRRCRNTCPGWNSSRKFPCLVGRVLTADARPSTGRPANSAPLDLASNGCRAAAERLCRHLDHRHEGLPLPFGDLAVEVDQALEMPVAHHRGGIEPDVADGWRHDGLEVECPAELVGEQVRIVAAKRLDDRNVDLEHDEEGRREPAAGFEPAHGSLAHTGTASELLLREAEELTDASGLTPER